MSVMVKNKTNKNYKRSQKGRSMVEMLGVLAIVGVLSVGGLNGYGVAMKKHKANELLHRASMLAATISAQIQSKGELPTTIENFGNGKYGTFDQSVTDALGGKGFTITISNMDSAVCTQLEKMQGGIAQKIECVDAGNDKKSAKLTFYKNLATNDEEGAKSPTGEKPDPACVDVECPVAGTTCSRGSCLCSDGTLPCKGACCGEGEICSAPGTGDSSSYGECVTPTGECVTNADCDPGEFCLFESYTSDTDAGTTCSVPANSVCTALTGDYVPKVVENTEEPLYGVTYSDAQMNWWSASNWCQANGSSLMTWATLNTLSGGDSDDARKIALQGGLGKISGYVWLEDARSSDSCTARRVNLPNGVVVSRDRASSSYFIALCR